MYCCWFSTSGWEENSLFLCEFPSKIGINVCTKCQNFLTIWWKMDVQWWQVELLFL